MKISIFIKINHIRTRYCIPFPNNNRVLTENCSERSNASKCIIKSQHLLLIVSFGTVFLTYAVQMQPREPDKPRNRIMAAK